MRMLIVFLGSLLIGASAFSAPPPLAQALCREVKKGLMKEGLDLRELEVPVDYASPSGAKTKIFYWVRKANKPAEGFPPLLLIHGGPGGASSTFLYWSSIIYGYPGDIVGLDVRGEGCSSEMASGFDPEAYRHLRARNIVRDLELLRRSLYGPDTAWRVFGQSRGSVVGHYYMEMFPAALESVHLHGYAMGYRQSMYNYSRTRAYFSARAANQFVSWNRGTKQALEKLKAWLESGPICFQVNVHGDVTSKHTVCGADVLDALSFNLASQSYWDTFAQKLTRLVTRNDSVDFGINIRLARAYLQSELEKNNYVLNFNYIVGTNGHEMGHPNPHVLAGIENDPYIQQAPICEGRFISKVMNAWYLSRYGTSYPSDIDPIDHASILESLKGFERIHGRKFVFRLYASENDSVAGPEAFDDERNAFGEWVDFQVLKATGHEGWFTDATVARALLHR